MIHIIFALIMNCNASSAGSTIAPHSSIILNNIEAGCTLYIHNATTGTVYEISSPGYPYTVIYPGDRIAFTLPAAGLQITNSTDQQSPVGGVEIEPAPTPTPGPTAGPGTGTPAEPPYKITTRITVPDSPGFEGAMAILVITAIVALWKYIKRIVA